MAGTPVSQRISERQPADELSLDHVISRERKQRLLNDNVHDHFTLSDLSFLFIDNPCFQRLRRLKQLSTANLVYPTAGHSRLEHSLGVAHMAGEYAEKLLKEQHVEHAEEWKKVIELAGGDGGSNCAGVIWDLSHFWGWIGAGMERSL